MKIGITRYAAFFVALTALTAGTASIAEDFNLNRPDAAANTLTSIETDASGVPAARPAPVEQAKAVNLLGIFHGNYCKTHPDICNDPNNPQNPSYCNYHPEDPTCDDPDDPANPNYCNYHPAECGEIPPTLPPMGVVSVRDQASRNLVSLFKTDYCAKHPDWCSDPNNPMNPNYCNTHPGEPGCSDPNDPSSPAYCDYHPAACGEVPPTMPLLSIAR